MMSKHFIVTYIVFVAIISAAFWFVGTLASPSSQQAAVARVTILPGEGVFQISDALTKEGVIDSRIVFVAYAVLSGKYDSFKPGTYIINKPLSTWNVVGMLTRGPADVEVTVAPGMTLKEIDGLLARNGIIESGTLKNLSPGLLDSRYPFLSGAKTLEGFLMPDTYRFKPSGDSETAASVMLDNFRKKISSSGVELKNLYRTLIIASLVEKEVISESDKRIVAGIIERRLVIGMPLQIDASVIYASCGGMFLGCSPLSPGDYKLDSPYNTYVVQGLPPTPISNPTLDSIVAAANPQKSNYLYYLSDPKTTGTVFSETLDEHSQNRYRYLGK